MSEPVPLPPEAGAASPDAPAPRGPAPRRPASRWLRRLGTAALFAAVAALWAPSVLPPFLDRVYYRGPVSDHFDGQRFFNPDGESGRPSPRIAAKFAWRSLTGRQPNPWPQVPVTPGYPPAAATPCPITPPSARESWARCVAAPDPRGMWVTWIGHSTVLVQAGGLAILTDPIWAERAGPAGLLGPRRVRAPGIRFDDLPPIDLVLLSHNHYDHLDLATLRRLWLRDRPQVVTSLGNDAILRRAGIEAQAADWGGRVPVRTKPGAPAAAVIVERVHHWGSRFGSDRNRALWSGFTVTLPGGNLFFAGDSGWGDGRWPAEAARHGSIRLALIPIGAYEPREMMAPSHLDPDEAVKVFQGLGAAHAVAVHWGTFKLSDEAIDAPPAALRAGLAKAGIAADRFRALEVGQPWQVPAE